MLLEREAILAAEDFELRPEEFYREAHRTLYLAIRSLHRQGEPVDLVTVAGYLRDAGQLEAIGGQTYLMQLMAQVPTAAGITHYAERIRQKYLLREVIKAADQLIADAYDGQADPDALCRTAEQRMMALTDLSAGRDLDATLIPWYDAELDAIQRRKDADARGYDRGFASPLPSLNSHLQPMSPGQMVVIAARPRIGKTSFAVQLAYEAASTQDQKGLFVSTEMSRDELAVRRLLAGSNMNRFAISNMHYRATNAEMVYGKLETAAENSMAIPLLLHDVPTITPSQILVVARRARKRLGGLDFIVVDYLQRLDDDNHTREDTPRVSAIARGLKSIAKEMGCAMIALAQLNRGAEDRDTRRPGLHHLRDSGMIEQEADVVVFLHRPDVNDPSRVEMGVAKQRDGGEGWVEVGFCPRQTWFYNSVSDIPADERGQG
jgi:replicative DNA helicase